MDLLFHTCLKKVQSSLIENTNAVLESIQESDRCRVLTKNYIGSITGFSQSLSSLMHPSQYECVFMLDRKHIYRKKCMCV